MRNVVVTGNAQKQLQKETKLAQFRWMVLKAVAPFGMMEFCAKPNLKG